MDLSVFELAFARLLAENVLPAAYGRQGEAFFRLTRLLLETNEKMNLTALKTEEDVLWKHIIDSLTAAAYIPRGASVLDVGTGAGFPAIPLALVRDDVRITAVDATQKKVRYIDGCCAALGITNLTAVSCRIEEAASLPAKSKEPAPFREKFDVVISRAVARLNVLSELTLPCCKIGGTVIAMKGDSGNAERLEAENGIRILGGRVREEIPFAIRNGTMEENRDIILIEKERPTTAQYPRRFAKITESPL